MKCSKREEKYFTEKPGIDEEFGRFGVSTNEKLIVRVLILNSL